jgi:hypothetical protein
MALDYTDPVNNDGLFDILGKIFYGMGVKNTARGTTIATAVSAAVASYKLKTDADLDLDRDIGGLEQAELTDRTNDTLLSAYAAMAQALLIGVMRIDSSDNRMNLTQSLEYLIDEMVSDSYYVDGNAVSATPSSSLGPDLNIYATFERGDGLDIETILDETVAVELTQVGAVPTITFVGEPAARNKFSENFPAGSGIITSRFPLTHGDSVLLNGDFESWSIPDVPDNWNVVTGTPGTTCRQSVVTEQTITISGTPTEGSHYLAITNPITGRAHRTPTLTYNATSEEVQAALRTLADFEDVTVSSTGTEPNYVHTVVFTGIGTSVAQMTPVYSFDTGSVATAVTVTGNVAANDGFSFGIEAHVSELTEIQQAVTIEPGVVYNLGFWFKSSGSGNEMSAALLDGASGSVCQDDQGVDQTEVFTISSGSRQHEGTFFKVAKTQEMPVYLKIWKSAADNSADYYIDDVILAPAFELYPGGPFMAMHAGREVTALGSANGIAVSNDYASEFAKYFDMAFDMAAKRLSLPVSGSNHLPDTLIA